MPPKIPEPTGKARTNLITAYATGTPGRALATNHRVSEATMTKRLRRRGATKGPATSDPRVDRKEAVRLYKEGTSLSTLMRHHGVTRRRTELLLEAWDVPVHRTPRHPQTDPKVDREEAVRLYTAGTSAQARALDAYRLFP